MYQEQVNKTQKVVCFQTRSPAAAPILVSPSKSPCPVGLLVALSCPSVLQIHRQGLSLHSSEAEAPRSLGLSQESSRNRSTVRRRQQTRGRWLCKRVKVGLISDKKVYGHQGWILSDDRSSRCSFFPHCCFCPGDKRNPNPRT